MNPVQLGEELGFYLKTELVEIKDFNVVKGFLNLVFEDDHYLRLFNRIRKEANYGYREKTDEADTIVVEYSSPNTNKPLHLGHVRNNLLGFSVAKILEAAGNKVYRTQIVNDRGIHICKSMVAWLKFAEKDEEGNRETPESTGEKGDKFVGRFYVIFDK